MGSAHFLTRMKKILNGLPCHALCLCLLPAVFVSCSNAQESERKLAHYNLDKPEKFFMPESLLEISGIAFIKGNPDTVYAIQDEEGKLFRLKWNEKKQIHTKFGKRGDYEDLSILGDKVYILKSNGKIYSFPLEERAFEETDDVKEWKSLLPPGEYESLFADEQTGRLYVLCKNCPADKGNDRVSGYVFQVGDTIVPAGGFSLDLHSLSAFTNRVKHGLRPSALARNPVTGEWFILSSVNKLLVITNDQWKVKDALHLNANEFNQPEGIAFDSRGNLYISNEGGDLSEGNILLFTRQSK
jgi:hypothetical protein